MLAVCMLAYLRAGVCACVPGCMLAWVCASMCVCVCVCVRASMCVRVHSCVVVCEAGTFQAQQPAWICSLGWLSGVKLCIANLYEQRWPLAPWLSGSGCKHTRHLHHWQMLGNITYMMCWWLPELVLNQLRASQICGCTTEERRSKVGYHSKPWTSDENVYLHLTVLLKSMVKA